MGVDCVGLLVGIARELEIPHEDVKGYSVRPDGHTLMDVLDRVLIRVDTPAIGRVVAFHFINPSWPQHAGILTDVGLIHTWAQAGKVVETTMPADYQDKIVGYWAW